MKIFVVNFIKIVSGLSWRMLFCCGIIVLSSCGTNEYGIKVPERELSDLPEFLPKIERSPGILQYSAPPKIGSEVLEIGKNPGLGMRDLHRAGITGRGIGIAAIGTPCLVDHVEYADRIQLYEEIGMVSWDPAHFYSTAALSLAAGNTIGAAPEADLYFIAVHENQKNRTSYGNTAKAILRLLEVNRSLPEDRKIRSLIIPRWWIGEEDAEGYTDLISAVTQAETAGILVVSFSFPHRIEGLGRESLADPDVPESYTIAEAQKDYFVHVSKNYPEKTEEVLEETLFFPMDSRTAAHPSAVDAYTIYPNFVTIGHIAYLAGLYALACQIDYGITPDRFWEYALETGDEITVKLEGAEYELKHIVDPKELLRAISKNRQE